MKPPLVQHQNIGFLSKENNCYVNSILQVLRFLPGFYFKESSKHDKIFSLSRVVNLNMSLLKGKTSPIYPSNILWSLRNKIFKDCDVPFKLNGQQDVPEILQTVINEHISGSRQHHFIHSHNISHLQRLLLLITLPLTSSLPESIKNKSRAWETDRDKQTDGSHHLATISRIAQRRLNLERWELFWFFR